MPGDFKKHQIAPEPAQKNCTVPVNGTMLFLTVSVLIPSVFLALTEYRESGQHSASRSESQSFLPVRFVFLIPFFFLRQQRGVFLGKLRNGGHAALQLLNAGERESRIEISVKT